MENESLLLQLGIAKLDFLSCKEKLILEKNIENINSLEKLSLDDISFIVKRVIKSKIWPINHLSDIVAKDISLMRIYKISFLHYEDDKYPFLLKQIYDPPYGLFIRGNEDVLLQQSIGIVGTRHPTGQGIVTTYEFADELAKSGYVIISGMAIGIDSAAHKGAINKGKTIAVLASGLDTLYPPINRTLASCIIEKGGCLVSEYSPCEPPLKWRFPQRNRLISGLSEAIVVMQSPPKSGALITADFALEQNKDLFFHEIAIDFDNKYSKKLFIPKNDKDAKIANIRCVHKYIEDGAPVLQSVSQLLEIKSKKTTNFSSNCFDTVNM